MSWTKPPRLRAGERFRGEDGRAYEVLRVTDCAAMVRPRERKRKEVRPQRGEHAGEVIEISTPEKGVYISAHSFVERIEEGEEEEPGIEGVTGISAREGGVE